jgi:hypothetical protein
VYWRHADDWSIRRCCERPCLLGGACSFTLLHDAIAFRRELFNAITDHLCPHLRPSKERGEDPPHRGFGENESDRDQDSDPCCERTNASEQARSTAASDVSDASAMGWEDDFNECKQADKCE